MDGLFDDIPVAAPQPAVPVYAAGNSAYAGQPVTNPQAAYATANAAYRDQNATAGTASNPSYDAPDVAGKDTSFHVNSQGQLSDPNGSALLGQNLHGMDLFGDIPMGNVALLPRTQGSLAAQKAEAARGVDPGTQQWISNDVFGFGPQMDAGKAAIDTAVGNVGRRILGQPVPYGAADAYSATQAADRDRQAEFAAAHPLQSAAYGLGGALTNPANAIGAGLVGDAYASGKGLAALGKASLVSGAIGVPTGALYGYSGDPSHPWRGAATGALWGGALGAASVPAGAVLGALGSGAVQTGRRWASGPISALGIAAPNLTDETINAAQALRMDMARRGVDVSLPEAVQQVTNNGTGLGRLQRVLESTKQGEGILAPYFADRPQQVQNAVGSYADTIAPATTNPSLIGPQAQTAAQGALDTTRQAINTQAQPFYDALRGEQFGPVFGPTVRASRSYQRALGQIRNDPELSAGIAGLPDDNLSVVNEVVKQLDRNVEASKQTALNPRGNNQKAGLRQAARSRADTLASIVSDNWRDARSTIEQGRATLLEPLEAGPVGAIAGSGAVPAQTGALYPSAPLAGAPAETGAAMRALNAQDPTVAPALTRQHILNTLDQSRPQLVGGDNQNLGANFAVNLAGTPERQATLAAGVQGLTEGQSKLDDLLQLLEGLRATGKRQSIGSRTAFNESDLADMKLTAVGKLIKRLGDPLEWGAGIADAIDRANWRRNVEGLSGLITVPPDQTAATLNAARSVTPPPPIPILPYLRGPAAAVPVLAQPTPARQR